MALAPKYRLKGNPDLKRVFKDGRTVSHGFFFIKFLKNQLKHGRAAVTVSRAVSTKAVVRNKIKRLIYGLLETTSFFTRPLDLVISISPIMVDKSFQEIKSEFNKATKPIFSQLK